MAEVAYTTVQPDLRFSFTTDDGGSVAVEHEKAFRTSDPKVIAYLDQAAEVTRALKQPRKRRTRAKAAV